MKNKVKPGTRAKMSSGKFFRTNPLVFSRFILVFILLFVVVSYYSNSFRHRTNTQKANTQNLDNKEVFEMLTKNSWCNNPEGPMGTSYNYSFLADGSYSWTHFSDYLEGSGKGFWNFKLSSTSGGIIYLDSGEALSFNLLANKLTIASLELDICKNQQVSPAMTVESLKVVHPSNYVIELASNSWYKTDELDLHRLPSKITFNLDGSYFAEFRNGECSYYGTWSYRIGTPYSGGSINRFVPEEDCDSRTDYKSTYHDYPSSVRNMVLDFEGSSYVKTPIEK